MGIRCEGFPLKAKLNRGKRFVSKDHPAQSVNQLMDCHAQHYGGNKDEGIRSDT